MIKRVGFRILTALILGAILMPGLLTAQNRDKKKGDKGGNRPVETVLEPHEIGLLIHDEEKSFQGYTLFPGKHHGLTVLMDNEGRIINSWMSDYEPGQSAYLLENGNMMRAALVKGKYNIGGGEGGRFEEFTWEGEMVWSMDYASDSYMSHHDFVPLANGNFLALCVETKSRAEAIAAGFNPALLRDATVNPEYIIEVEKIGRDDYRIVWEWHVWDHMIQDFDKSKANYGKPEDHPELVDVNGTGQRIPAFWNHGNSIDYNEELDQIILSIRGTSEFWIIDHSTTTEEAKTDRGGILYRWGNPAAYGRGDREDRRLYQQHDAQWIKEGNPGAGNILIFNNGIDRPGIKHSTIEEVVVPVGEDGSYPDLAQGEAYAPRDAVWTYAAEDRQEFYSPEISGAQRLPNGNTLICEGIPGHFFEVTPEGETVWSYGNPIVVNEVLKKGEVPTIDGRGHPNNAVFKIHRYAPDYPGLAGKDLTPGEYLCQ
ncbi:MAG: aryl-sulfate sulfotransferase [Spirochaetales bacterium]|nr:aryl-sulfate sulfotransferase [Spirochaetales bacterium]